MKKWMNKCIEACRNMKYRKKMNLVLIMVGLLPLAVVSIFMILGFRKILVEKEYESMEVALNQTLNTIDKQVGIYTNLMNYLVFDDDLQKVLGEEQTKDFKSYNNYVNIVDPILNTPKFYQEGIRRVTIYSQNIKIPHDVTLAPMEEIQDKKWFSQLEQASKCIWVWSGTDREEILAIRTFPGYRDTKSYLGMYCSLESLIEPLYYFQKDGAGILLTDEDDRILYLESALEDSAEIKSVKEIKNTYSYLKREITGLPLNIYIFMDQSEIYSGFYDMMARIILVVVFCLISILIISRSMSRLMVNRIERLITCVNQIEYSTMEIDLNDQSRDEIGVLIRSFHQMLAEIKRLIKEVYESRIRQQKLEMQALQAQINPHFLYNTLSMINWKAISAGEEDISTITLALSDYYRTTLNRGETFINIRGEILNIRSYLEIQLMMHDYGFEVEYDLDPSLDEYQMPKLILQPLVENALEHGLDVKEEGEKILRISCRQDHEDIIWTVEDNGVGMEEVVADNMVKTHTSGYGVRNVNERLILLYGEHYGLRIESEPGKGTCVEVRIPKNHPEKA
ncbi:MAG: sensor histidine kinase [Oliverpabstia sp.]